MKTIRSIILLAGMFISLQWLHAQTTPQGLELLPSGQGLPTGTYWLISPGLKAGYNLLPCPPLPVFNQFPYAVYAMTDGIYLVDDTSKTGGLNADALDVEANAVMDIIAEAVAVRTARAAPRFAVTSAMFASSLASTYAYGNPVYLLDMAASIAGDGSTTASFSIGGGTNNVPYDILMTTNIVTPVSNWTWLGIGYTSNNYTFYEQPADNAFYILAKPSKTMTVGWGGDIYGQCDVPSGITNILMVAAGYGYSLGLLNNGTVVGWGSSSANGWVPTNLVNNVTMIAAAWDHNVALLTNGTVQAWGANVFGILNVPANLTNVTVIVAQSLNTLALCSNGTVVAWGYDGAGQCDVPSALTNVTAIAAGYEHSLAVSNGYVVAWGFSGSGQCNVPAGLSNVWDVAAGWAHSIALKKDGTVVCWGDNLYGECNVPAGLSNVVAIAAGGDAIFSDPYMGAALPYSLALKSDGTVVAWGAGDVVNPIEGLSNVISISGGLYHGLAIRTGPPTPVITLEPVDIYQAQGSNITFTARGAGLYGVTYQWQYTNVDISGATGSSLTLTNVQTSQDGAYDVVVTDNGGMGSLVSSNASLTVVTPPVFTYQSSPTNIVTIYGKNLNFSGTAVAPGTNNGFPISYHWQLNGTNIPSATASTYNFYINDANAGVYTLVAQNAAGSASVSWQTALTNAIDVTQDLLLIYNTNSVDSATAVNYYLAHRPGVSGANVLGLGYSNPMTPGYFETITPTELTNQIFNPILSWLASNPAKRPQYVILFMDLPSRVDFTSAYPTNGYPFYVNPQPSPPNDVGVQLHSLVSGWQPYVTHLNMGMTNTVNRTNDCIAYINKLASIGVLVFSNSPILSASLGGYSNTNFVLDDVRFAFTNTSLDYSYNGNVISVATNSLLAAGVAPSAIHFYDGLIVSNYPVDITNHITTFNYNGSYVTVTNDNLMIHATNAANVAGYVSWGVNGGIAGYQTYDGEISWHGNSGWWLINTIESWNGTQVPVQGTFDFWFLSTAFGGSNYSNTPVGAVTTVYEPGLGGKNDNSTYFGLWVSGKNFGICAWESKSSPYFQAVGDPLTTK